MILLARELDANFLGVFSNDKHKIEVGFQTPTRPLSESPKDEAITYPKGK